MEESQEMGEKSAKKLRRRELPCEWQSDFLTHLREGSSVNEACRAAQVPRRLLKKPIIGTSGTLT
jgi:hypothetical protein